MQHTNLDDGKTCVIVGGFASYIIWANKNVGFDQWGNEWHNKDDPEPADPNFIDNCLDRYNEIIRQVDEHLKHDKNLIQ